jgi:hypothetical protein
MVHAHAKPVDARGLEHLHHVGRTAIGEGRLNKVGRQRRRVSRELGCDRLKRRAALKPERLIRAHFATREIAASAGVSLLTAVSENFI